jgi:hypothetical protein
LVLSWVLVLGKHITIVNSIVQVAVDINDVVLNAATVWVRWVNLDLVKDGRLGVVDDWVNVFVEEVWVLEEGLELGKNPVMLEQGCGEEVLEQWVRQMLTEEWESQVLLEQWVTHNFVQSIDGLVINLVVV